MSGVLMTEASTLLFIRQAQEHARLVAMLLALTTGVLLISDLWEQTLTQDAMASAGRGVIFILLALGLMGTRRLSVALTAMLCATTAMGLLNVGRTIVLTDWLELMMLIVCSGLLFTSPSRRNDMQSGETE